VLFADLAATTVAVAATAGRKAKIELLAGCLRALADSALPTGDPGRVLAAGAAFLAGDPLQRRTGVGWAGVRELPPPAEVATLTVGVVDAALTRIAAVTGPGSQAERRRQVEALFAATTSGEQRLLVGLLTGELRQGAQAGLLADAVARAAGVEVAQVRRALLLAGDITVVAATALRAGAAGLAGFHLSVGRPLAPMLAGSAGSVSDALASTGVPVVADTKIDGTRIQVHRDRDDIAVFSRSLDELTGRLPQVVAAVRQLPVRSVVLDGEALGTAADGRPLPFQETASQAARGRRGAGSPAGGSAGRPAPLAGPVLLRPFLFDALHLDGADLIDQPATDRWRALASVVPADLLVDRVEITDPELAEAQATAAFTAALGHGHEGLVLKAAGAPYDVGRRGSAWVKVKPRHTLDLVVLAAEWGHGRRQGWLSNLHLGARAPDGDGFVMLGKTFKGLTDEMLRWQTERLLELAVERGDWVVTVRPELVVEIAFDGVQTSPRYPGGVALRFARVLRHRPDKTAGMADTLDAVRAIHAPPAG